VERTFGNAHQMANADVKAWAALRRDGLTREGRKRPRLGIKKAMAIVAALRGTNELMTTSASSHWFQL